jgi:hypothetical protein
MSACSDSDIDHIGMSLLDRSLAKARWTHTAHFAAALWLLSKSGDAALQQMPGLIRAYNEATGVANTDTGGYHETITQASMRAARSWLAAHPGEPLQRVLERLLAAGYGDPRWLLAYWSRSVLFSVQARRAWVEPDIQPLPFD